MEPVRLMVVDTSAVMRRIFAESLAGFQDIALVATAATADIALARALDKRPQVIVLQADPEIRPLDLLDDLRRAFPAVPVLMFSSPAADAAGVTLEALARGAVDYVGRPDPVLERFAAIARVRDELVPRVRAYARPALDTLIKGPAPQITVLKKPEILAIGASTGGPNAVTEVLSGLGRRPSVPIVIVQHMPPDFTSLFAQRLTAVSGIPCHEAKDGEVLKASHAYLAPGDYHMAVERTGHNVKIRLDRGPLENSVRPAVDVLFRSLAQAYGDSCLALVLTGMGRDALNGCEALHAAGSHVIAQDEATSIVWGMPGTVARAGIADAVLALPRIGPEARRLVEEGHRQQTARTSLR